MKTLIKQGTALIVLTCFLCSGLVVGCGGAPVAGRSTLDSIRAQFPEVEDAPLEPLESVVPPVREEPDQTTAFAQRVLRGESVPFSGLLLSDSAAAFVASEYEALTQRFELALTQQRDLDQARLTRDIESFRLRLNSDRERFLIIVEGQERHILQLEEIIRNQDEPNLVEILSFVGIGALGILIGIVVGFFVSI